MRYKKYAKMLMLSFLMFSLTVTSWGGAFATAAFAAEAGAEEDNSAGNTGAPNKAVLGGLLAIGLIAAFSGHHDSTPAAGQTPSSASNSTNTNQTTTNTNQNTNTTTSSGSSSSTGSLTADEQRALTLLNNDRAANGLPALKAVTKLNSLAENYAQDMINRNFFSHYNPEGQSPFDRMSQYGINYSYAGENLAINTSVTNAETAFMNSPGHRANILNPNYTQVGLGVRYDSKGSVYVVQEFIRP